MNVLEESLPYFLFISFILTAIVFLYDSFDINGIGFFNSLITMYIVKVSFKLTFLTVAEDDYRNQLIRTIRTTIKDIRESDSVLTLDELFTRLVQILEIKKSFDNENKDHYDECIKFIYVLKVNLVQTLAGHALGLEFKVRLNSILNAIERVYVRN